MVTRKEVEQKIFEDDYLAVRGLLRQTNDPDILWVVAKNDKYGQTNDIFYEKDLSSAKYEAVRIALAEHCDLEHLAMYLGFDNSPDGREALKEILEIRALQKIENHDIEAMRKMAVATSDPGLLEAIADNDPNGELNDVFFAKDLKAQKYERVRIALAQHCDLEHIAQFMKCQGTKNGRDELRQIFQQRKELFAQVFKTPLFEDAIRDYGDLLNEEQLYEVIKFHGSMKVSKERLMEGIQMIETQYEDTVPYLWQCLFEDKEWNPTAAEAIRDAMADYNMEHNEDMDHYIEDDRPSPALRLYDRLVPEEPDTSLDHFEQWRRDDFWSDVAYDDGR